jgi:hypothetical protein
MYLSSVFLAAVALFSTSLALKFNIDPTVTAGQNTTITVINDAKDETAVNFTVALYTVS